MERIEEGLEVNIQPVSINFATLPDPEFIKNAIEGAFRVEPYYDRKPVEHNGVEYPPTRVLWVYDLLFCKRRRCVELVCRTTHIKKEKMVKMVIGTLVHRELGKRMFVNAEFEKKVAKAYKSEYLLVGRVDCYINGTVVDFKVVTRNTLPENPDPYYQDQLQLYMWLTDSVASYLVLINAWDGKIKVFLVNRAEERINRLLERGVEIVRALSTGKYPEPEPDYDWVCEDCIDSTCPHRRV